jgi:hypothetical protein
MPGQRASTASFLGVVILTAVVAAPTSAMADGVVDRTRPLCPYPQVARWMGSGITDDAGQLRVRHSFTPSMTGSS